MSTWLEATLLTRPPRLLRPLLPGTEWQGASSAAQPTIYLTFDDGPIPDETPWVLEQLALYQAAATFFCVGQNLARYPEIARAALAAGHRLANHTQHHRSAWSSSRSNYLADVAECQAQLKDFLTPNTEHPTPNTKNPTPNTSSSPHLTSSPLFRPPYGRLTWPLLRALKPDYRIIFWSVLTRDYDTTLSPETCLRLALAAVRPSDIVVFHDSRKASARLRHVLPRLLAHCAEQGWQFATL